LVVLGLHIDRGPIGEVDPHPVRHLVLAFHACDRLAGERVPLRDLVFPPALTFLHVIVQAHSVTSTNGISWPSRYFFVIALSVWPRSCCVRSSGQPLRRSRSAPRERISWKVGRCFGGTVSNSPVASRALAKPRLIDSGASPLARRCLFFTTWCTR